MLNTNNKKCNQMLLIIKHTSINTAPNGDTPPTNIAKYFCIYQGTGCIGIIRNNSFVGHGNSITSLLKPKYAPKYTNGAFIIIPIIPNDTALLLPSCHTNKFNIKNIKKFIVGSNNAVCNVCFCQFVQPNILQQRTLKYPANIPINEPLFAGDKNSNAANTNVNKHTPNTYLYLQYIYKWESVRMGVPVHQYQLHMKIMDYLVF